MNAEPAFWDDLIRSIPVCVEIEKNFLNIQAEFLSYMNHEHKFPATGSRNTISTPNIKITSIDGKDEGEHLYSGNWDVCFAGTSPTSESRQWGNFEMLKKFVKWKTKTDIEIQIEYSKAYFKTFNSIVEKFADYGQCSGGMFSILSPGTEIKAHHGSSETVRCHFCIIEDPKCMITVGEETRTWEEGKILAFKDGPPYKHSVVHSGESDRVVLIFDFELDYLRQKFPGSNL
jgi:hypothetical protein